MFSTFTGSSRRPRNVNLSGQTGNPFANTSWSPSLASNATKTVSDAQAEREKRQAERQRLKAAGKIQKTWRGHRSRRILADDRRVTYDQMLRCLADNTTESLSQLPFVLDLLLAFFSRRKADDIRRALIFAHNCDSVGLDKVLRSGAHISRQSRLLDVLISSILAVSSKYERYQEPEYLLKLVIRIIADSPVTVIRDVGEYYHALAKLSRIQDAQSCTSLLFEAVTIPLQKDAATDETAIYQALVFRFLSESDMVLLEAHVPQFSERIPAVKVAETIRTSYQSTTEASMSKDALLWLLAHFIDLGHSWPNPFGNISYLGALLPQLSFLSPEISLRLALRATAEQSSQDIRDSSAVSMPPYVSRMLLSLVEHDGISKLLRDFSDILTRSSSLDVQGTSILAGYILMLLQCFPNSADDTRMRLFLEQIPTPSGQVPTVKYLWQMMKETTVFRKVKTESEEPQLVLQRFLHRSWRLPKHRSEEGEWPIILLFLELYIFILRLSDDEDFASGMTAQTLRGDSSISRLRACSLPLEDVKALTIFLKNAAFPTYYKPRELLRKPPTSEPNSSSRLDSISEASKPGAPNTAAPALFADSAETGLDSIRSIMTTPLKMMYERDSRTHFLDPNDWLMPGKLEGEDFIDAVIEEDDIRHKEEEEDGSDEEIDSATLDHDIDSTYSSFTTQRLSRHARLERLRLQQLRSQRERKLAEMGPRLEILKHMPFIVPFDTRVMIFRQFVHLDQGRRGGGSPFNGFLSPFGRHHARIRRGNLFKDAMAQFYPLGDGLKDPIQITFVDQFDTPEAGIDGGGVTKEFLTSVTAEIFATSDNELTMFASNEQGLLFPSPTAADVLREDLRTRGWTERDTEWRESLAKLCKTYEFLGRVVGKCMYEGILVDLAFAGFFLLKWPSAGPKEENNYKGSINDLREMDEELYKGMLRLKNYPGDVSELGFDFTVEDQVSHPGRPVKTITRKLIAHGDETTVNNDNRLLYISYMARHRLVVQPALQTAAFLRGLRAIIHPSWLSMFNQSELQRLVGGDSSEIDIEDLRRNTIYSGVYEIGDDQQEHPTIQLFWRVMRSFSDAQRRDVLKYVSSTPRAPLLGFSQLNPKFSIRDAGTDESRLPSTSTCVNLLKLPRYKSEETLREKLLYAVTSGAGFDLS
ncbi:hypothetical protein HIM_07414 [Hirsutella minnesotensis 3608]|uniref:HECT-type E3 ubiquitin transferase n=1 Tax=Hirsutella minnesotensis 3608 TaxID=1043627 RepID=A0A0F7ZYX2_9HYPO|nr:hypothetical protein HIM_07414 [Hirsutella minnesotensis 3608]